MHIHFNEHPSRQKIDVTTKDFQQVSGRRVRAVQLGSRLLGFSGEDIDAVALRLAEGKLHIQLQDRHGAAQGEYQVPSTDLLKADMQRLKDAGVSFSAREIDELQNLMRLSMSGSVSHDDILLLLDEISHLAPSLEGRAAIDAGDIYPELSRHTRRLLNAMPEDIQRLVILANQGRFGDDVWDGIQLLTQIDARQQPGLSRFLSGQGTFDYIAAAELRAILNHGPSGQGIPLAKVDPQAFNELLKHMEGAVLDDKTLSLRFSGGVSRFIFENFDLKIPNFAGSNSLEQLEQQVLSQIGARPARISPSQQLRQLLLNQLDTHTYKELADFLAGKQGAGFGTEAKEGFLHFLKESNHVESSNRLSGISSKSFERLQHFIGSQKLDLNTLLKDRLPTTTKEPSNQHLLKEQMQRLNPKERLGLFLLDHVDPIRHRNLFDFFSGKHAGLTRLTPTMKRDLQTMLQQGTMKPVEGGLKHFSNKRFEQLMQFLDQTKAEVNKDFVPRQAALQKAVSALASDRMEADPSNPASSEKAMRVPANRRDSKLLGQIMSDALLHETGSDHDLKLTQQLKLHLDNFRKVALLDQAWKGSRLSQATLSGELNPLDGSRKVSQTLRDMVRLITDEQDAVEWDLWQQPEKSGSSIKQRVLKESKGVERYLHLDKNLPAKGDPFAARLEELGWMQRFEELADRLDRHRDSNPSRLRAALERATKVLNEFSQVMTHEKGTQFEYHGNSPLSAEKLSQFKAFRDALVQGNKFDLEKLFEGPFLRAEFANSEKQHQTEMNRLLPMMKEAFSRSEGEPVRILERMMERIAMQAEGSSDRSNLLRQYMGNLNDFNQHQNLNGQPMYLSLPLRWDDQESEMEMAYFPKPNGRQKDSFLVVIHLDFENWGHLRVDVLKESDRFSATFWAGNTRIRSQIQQRLAAFSVKLQEKTGRDVDLVVKLEANKAQKRVSQMCLPAHDGDLDVKI